MTTELDIIKRPHSKTEYTDRDLQDLMQCVDDPLFFIKNFVRIQHPIKGSQPFNTFPFQEEMIIAFHTHRFNVTLTARQMGKAGCLTTPVLTPAGFVALGDLKVGDTIFGQDGKPTNITFITETMTDHECYEIEFIHGEKIVADAEHLWVVNIPGYRKARTETVTTKRMLELVEYYRSSNSGQSISIDHCKPLFFEDSGVSVDPYLFGVFLGDGTIWDARIACHLDDYPHYCAQAKARGFTPTIFKPRALNGVIQNCGTFSFGREFRDELDLIFKRRKFVDDGTRKYIPRSMIFTSYEKRLALIQGLMDTDGTVEKNGVCRFYQSDKEFAEEFRLLLSTMGIKSTLRSKNTTHKDCWTVTFTSDLNVCLLPRKAARLANIKNHPKNKRIYIREIRPTASVPVRCLQVDNADHMFLWGETLIPTHNTTCAAAYLLWKAMFNPDTTILITANKMLQALEIMDRIRYAYENLPNHIRAGVTEYNKGSIAFDNGSRIVSRATTSDAGRGLSITLLYCDEFAFVQPRMQKEFWTSIQPTLSTGGACIITSTPKSDEDEFAQVYKAGMNNTDEFGNPRPGGLGSNDFFALTIPWDRHPERDEKWAETYRQQLGEARFRQEFECVTSATRVFLKHGMVGVQGEDISNEEMNIGALFRLLKMAA